MGRARDAGTARARRRGGAAGRGSLTPASRAAAVLLALATAAACKLATDLDQIIALEVFLPDSGRVAVGDTLRPTARALNGRGDSVAAAIVWASLDTAIAEVLDSTTGETLGKAVGAGRLQARVGSLRSNPQTLTVVAAPAGGATYPSGAPSGTFSIRQTFVGELRP